MFLSSLIELETRRGKALNINHHNGGDILLRGIHFHRLLEQIYFQCFRVQISLPSFCHVVSVDCCASVAHYLWISWKDVCFKQTKESE